MVKNTKFRANSGSSSSQISTKKTAFSDSDFRNGIVPRDISNKITGFLAAQSQDFEKKVEKNASIS